MKFYIPFGDWSDDGHCKYVSVLVEAPSMELLLEAEKKIKEKYGDDFFEGFANEYEEPFLSEDVKNALKENCGSLISDETLNSEYLSVDEVADCFISLLNTFGANITRVPDYPMICNWTCQGFETVGYGCFE